LRNTEKVAKYLYEKSTENVEIFDVKNPPSSSDLTLGAYPDSEHAEKVKKNLEELLSENKYLGGFLCQGKVDSAIKKLHGTKAYSSSKHPMTPERIERLRKAESHPDEKDLENGFEFMQNVIKNN